MFHLQVERDDQDSDSGVDAAPPAATTTATTTTTATAPAPDAASPPTLSSLPPLEPGAPPAPTTTLQAPPSPVCAPSSSPSRLTAPPALPLSAPALLSCASSGGSSTAGAGAGGGASSTGSRSVTPRPTFDADADSIRFSTGIPSVQVVYGHIRLFRGATSQPPTTAPPLPPSAASGAGSGTSGTPPDATADGPPPPAAADTPPDAKSRLVCILAVPLHITAADLCAFIRPHIPHVEEMRILRDARSSSGCYMVLARLSTQEHADDFAAAYNGKPFASFDSHVCHVVYVSGVALEPGAAMTSSSDPEVAAAAPGVGATSSFELSPGLTELPTCPVCLERLDPSASGMFTTVCNHTFHCQCLGSWLDSSCPVCRYCQAEESMPVACQVCGLTMNLWMCLICGHVGCGRYDGEHAVAHYMETSHTYSMELKSQRVWDYTGDGYVHRLIQNSRDGKVVEFPDPRMAGAERSQVPPLTDAVESEMLMQKMDNMSYEYGLLLTSQLETQREYYEAQLCEAREESVHAVQRAEQTAADLAAVQNKLAVSEKERKAAVKKCNTHSQALAELKEEHVFVKDMNASLSDNQSKWERRVAALEAKLAATVEAHKAEVEELQQQVNDLMFSLDTQAKVEGMADKEEVRAGALLVADGGGGGAGAGVGGRGTRAGGRRRKGRRK